LDGRSRLGGGGVGLLGAEPWARILPPLPVERIPRTPPCRLCGAFLGSALPISHGSFQSHRGIEQKPAWSDYVVVSSQIKCLPEETIFALKPIQLITFVLCAHFAGSFKQTPLGRGSIRHFLSSLFGGQTPATPPIRRMTSPTGPSGEFYRCLRCWRRYRC